LKNVIGRFAPTPSGALHFGSLIAAVGSYISAKSQGGKWLVRIEDIDQARTIGGADSEILRQLEAYALVWDGEVLYHKAIGSKPTAPRSPLWAIWSIPAAVLDPICRNLEAFILRYVRQIAPKRPLPCAFALATKQSDLPIGFAGISRNIYVKR
jgi:hypothetical protein